MFEGIRLKGYYPGIFLKLMSFVFIGACSLYVLGVSVFYTRRKVKGMKNCQQKPYVSASHAFN